MIEYTFAWFMAAVPEPKAKNFTTQLGVHCEEVNEMLVELEATDDDTEVLVRDARNAMHKLANHLKGNAGCVRIPVENRINYFDAICDQIVTAVGCARMRGDDVIGGMYEVNGSNFSKFVDGKPIFDENMKVAKGPSYYKADLQNFIGVFPGYTD